MARTVLVVDDEVKLRALLRDYLESEGYTVLEAGDGRRALDLAGEAHPDLVVLDLGLPDVPGEAVARELRSVSAVPIVMLTARAAEEDRIRGLELGADDYVTKPFSVPELLARMRVALRRGARGIEAGDRVVRIEDVEIDLARRIVTRAGVEVHLTPTEYGLVRFLAQNAGRVVTHGQLLRSVLGNGYEDAIGSLRVYIASLRRKLEADPSEPRLIVTEPGVGYRLKAE